jgi:protein-disulfide isomerase
VFSDFQCPFCSRVNPTFAEIEKTYGEKVRVVWKNQPLAFHPRAEPAAELAMEAKAQKGDKGFWEAHDVLFKNQQKLSDEDLLGYAKELNLDVDKVKTAIADKRYYKDMVTDQDLADDLQASGTPHMFINGRRLVGAQPIEKFKTIIDEEIKKSEGLLAKGVAAKELYSELIKDGKTPPPPEKKTIDAPGPDSPSKGGEKAKVVMAIFSDFECPFCKRVEDTLKQVEKNYGEKVKLVWRHKPLPMHKNAPLASEASQEVFKQKGRDAFWKYHDKLFEKLGTPDALSRANLESYAEEFVDMAKFKEALDKNTHKEFVNAESKSADKAGISGTPAFVIGQIKDKELSGYFLSGAQPYSKFKKLIDKALAEAGEKGGGGDAGGDKPAKKKKKAGN